MKYVDIVVNFLNNTQGEIYDYQIRFLLLEMFNLDIEESKLKKILDSSIWMSLNNSIAWDDSDDFIKDMNKLKEKVLKEIK